MLHHQLGKGVMQGPASGGIKAPVLCFTTNWGRVYCKAPRLVGSRPWGYASPPNGEGCTVIIQGPASGGIKALGLCFTTNWGRV
jgi:hypothetical protein